MEMESAGKSHSNYCHVEVEVGEMFLQLLVKDDAPIKIIDGFLHKYLARMLRPFWRIWP